MTVDSIFTQAKTFIVINGLNVLFALIILLIGFKLANYITKLVDKNMRKKKLDETVIGFLHSVINVTLKILIVIVAADQAGIKATSFVAVIGAASFAVGLALQGSLSNFAGGVLILVLKPFKIGDFIETSGYSGVVKKIQVFQTELLTGDNKKIIVPNGNLSNSSIINYSAMETRRVDLVFGVGYTDDIKKVKKILTNIVLSYDLALKDPEPSILLGELADSTVNLYVRVWCETKDYWTVYFHILENVKLEFDKEGVNIPYPQMDVHIKNNE